MKFTLKPYQAEAVDDTLRTLERARKLYRDDGKASSVSLSATTGAGFDSADGTFLAYAPDGNVARLLRWIDQAEAAPGLWSSTR